MSAHGKKYWIKLYIELLNDDKVAPLNDSAYRRFIECLLLAGELDEDGFLPPLNRMAWKLRLGESALQTDLTHLAQNGLLELKQHPEGDERWYVTKFTERQKPSPGSERTREYRKRKKEEETETETYRTVTQVTKRHENVTPTPTVLYGQFDRTPGPGGKGYNLPENPPTFPPAAQLMHDLTDRYPGSVNSRYLAERLGDNPDREALAHVVKVWMARGYNMNNYEGMCDWYDERVKNPQWTPPTNGKKNAAGNNESAIEAIWRKALQAIDRGRVDDERLKTAIKAVGGSGAIKQANEFTTPKLKGRLFDEYQRVATAS